MNRILISALVVALTTILSLGDVTFGRALTQEPARPYIEVLISRSGTIDQPRCILSVTPAPDGSLATKSANANRAPATPVPASDSLRASYALESLGAPVEVASIPKFMVKVATQTRCWRGNRMVGQLNIPIFDNATSLKNLTLADGESIEFMIRPTEAQDETFKVSVILRR